MQLPFLLSHEGSQVAVTLVDLELMIPFISIYCREKLGPRKGGENSVRPGDRVAVKGRDSINSPVVNTEPPFAFLQNDDDRSGHGTSALFYNVKFFKGVHALLNQTRLTR